MNFVSESELQTQKEAGLANDEPVDHRPLYERLKEVREKAEAEREEMFALSGLKNNIWMNIIHGDFRKSIQGIR